MNVVRIPAMRLAAAHGFEGAMSMVMDECIVAGMLFGDPVTIRWDLVTGDLLVALHYDDSASWPA